jgi:phage tail protein X
VTGLAPDLRSTLAANTRGIMARALKANPGLADD